VLAAVEKWPGRQQEGRNRFLREPGNRPLGPCRSRPALMESSKK